MTKARQLFLCFSVLLLASCSLSTGERIRGIAEKKHFSYRVETVDGFSHAVFSNNKYVQDSDDALHIYLEGDGQPWRFRYIVSADPTSRHPLMLDLMEKDNFGAIYVGRPCYNGFHNEPSCTSNLWTMARHSQTVVNSMAKVIDRLRKKRGAKKLHLYGHSGGGAIAMLLANRLKNVEVVVTLAGNLDLAAWTQHHGYTPLYGSVNPATQPRLDSSIHQIHLLAGKDKNVPTELVLSWIKKQTNASHYVFDNFSHNCCWAKVWPRVLVYLSSISSAQHIDVRLLSEFGNLPPRVGAE